MKTYTEYSVTVKRDESNYGDVTRAEAHEIAARITKSLEQQFPEINVRQCDMIGHGRLDATSGPDASICDAIDRAATTALEAAL
jgi:hypothetical protein